MALIFVPSARFASPDATEVSGPYLVERGKSTGIFAESDLSMKLGHGHDLDLIPGDSVTTNRGWSTKDAEYKYRDIYISAEDTALYAPLPPGMRLQNRVKLMRDGDDPAACRELPDGIGGAGTIYVRDLAVDDNICAFTYEGRWAMLRVNRLPDASYRFLDVRVFELEK
jgi:hypothetical protein